MSRQDCRMVPAAAAGAAVCFLGGVSFLPSGSFLSSGRPLARPALGSDRAPVSGIVAPCVTNSGLGVCAAAASLAAVCTVAARAARKGHGRQAGRVAAAAVLTTDSAGRPRFSTPEKPIIPSEEPGVAMPLGFFDPLGFSKNPLMVFPGDSTGWKHLRASEIKHGRFAMMAAVGNAAAHYWKNPGFEDVPTGLAALGTDKGVEGFCILFTCIGLFEACNWKQGVDGVPGSYGDPFKWQSFTPEMRTKELNNGRLAMAAISGQVVAEMQTGLDPIQQFGL